MKFKLRFIKLLVILILSIKISAQNQEEKVLYTPEYKFRDGIFLDFNQVKKNNPILKKDIVFTEKYSETEFYDRILDKKKLEYRDTVGNILNIPSNQIWGYSQNGTLYIRWTNEFYRIFNIARFSNFVVYENVYVNNYNDPFMTADPFMRGISASANVSKVMKQYILDFETGNIMDYNTQTLFKIMSNDEQLSKEYSDLSNRKKRQLMFLYLRKYNDKYPLYLPKY